MHAVKYGPCRYNEKRNGEQLRNRKLELPNIIAGRTAFIEKGDRHHDEVSGRWNHPEIPALGQEADDDQKENQKAAPYQEKYIDHSFS